MKKQYLQTICSKLNERGFTEYDAEDILSNDRQPFSCDKGEVLALSWLPEENLKQIAEYDAGYQTAKNFSELYQAWGREGFFKFTPYILDTDKNTTMCVRHNRFLHMFRGYHYQLSGTPDGSGDYGSGLLRTDKVIQLVSRDALAGKSILGFVLLYSAMIDCGFQNDNFRDMFYKDKTAVDDYFKKSMSFWRVKVEYDYSTLKNYIHYRDGMLKTGECGDTVYSVCSKHGTLCRFWSSPECVEVEYCYNKDNGVGDSKIVRFDIPKASDGISEKIKAKWCEEEEGELQTMFEDACEAYGAKIEYFILLMLLKLVGINANWVAVYPLKKMGYISKVGNTDSVPINNFSDVVSRLEWRGGEK